MGLLNSCSDDKKGKDKKNKDIDLILKDKNINKSSIPEGLEKLLKILCEYDIHIILDDSTSMLMNSGESKHTRWTEALEAIQMIAEVALLYDDDGIDLHFLNHEYSYNIKNMIDMNNIFKITPRGGTNIGATLTKLFNKFLIDLQKNNKTKPYNIIVITDGAATDKDMMVTAILNLINELIKYGLDPYKKIGIQFFQIGNDKSSSDFLKWLDDDLNKVYNIPDIIDCTYFISKVSLQYTILKSLLGAIDRDY